MEFKGSSGEWKVQSDGFLTASDSKPFYAIGKIYSTHLGIEEYLANKKVVECAPELLEMVIKLKGLLEDEVPEFNIPELNELIKRATE